VVSSQNHDGVLFEVVGFKPIKHASEGIIDGCDEFVVVGDLAADGRGVRVERREFDLGRVATIGGLKSDGILGVFLVGGADLTLVAYGVVDVGEEGFLGLIGQLAERFFE